MKHKKKKNKNATNFKKQKENRQPKNEKRKFEENQKLNNENGKEKNINEREVKKKRDRHCYFRGRYIAHSFKKKNCMYVYL